MMRTPACREEAAVLNLVVSGRWPSDAPPELSAHARGCGNCREVAEVAMLFREDRASAIDRVTVPPAGQVWWRAAVRARLEAARTATRPITWLQGLAGASLAGAVGAAGVFTWPTVSGAAARVASAVLGFEPGWREAMAPVVEVMSTSLPLVVGAAACTVLAPLLVLWFALAGENQE